MDEIPVSPPPQAVAPMQKPSHKTPLLIAGLVLLFGSIFGGLYLVKSSVKEVACTMEAKLCPDGSSVGRVRPTCDFAPCPTVEVSTSNWYTYTNRTFRYEAKYPIDWTVNETTSVGNIQGVEFIEKNYVDWQALFKISVLGNKNNLDLNGWIEENKPKDPTGGSLVQKIEDVLVSGLPAKKMTVFVFDHEEIILLIQKDSFIYELRYTGNTPNDTKIDKHKRIYDNILSTFKFL